MYSHAVPESSEPEATPRRRACIGILMLQTRFPRPHGDIGNAATFDFPVDYQVVDGASPKRVVRERAAALLQPFVAGGRQLIDRGALAITTSCGFLSLFQAELAAALPVPVATSSLLQADWVQRLLPAGQRVGIVTIDSQALSAEHLRAAGAAIDAPVEGMDPASEFARGLLDDEPEMDLQQAGREVVAAAQRLVARRPDVGAIVLECTNMPPYAAAVAAATGRPVFDAVTLLRWLWSGVVRAPS